MGSRQRWRIIQPIAHHHHLPTTRNKSLDKSDFRYRVIGRSPVLNAKLLSKQRP